MAKPANFVSEMVDVANIALSMIGESEEELLDSLTDETTTATKVLRFIWLKLREVQNGGIWEELTERTVLAAPLDDVSADPSYDFAYRYALPDNFLLPHPEQLYPCRFDGAFLYTDVASDFPLVYGKYSEDPGEWSAELLECVYTILAMALCVPIAENKVERDNWADRYRMLIEPRAHRLNSYNKRQPESRYRQGSWSRMRGRNR